MNIQDDKVFRALLAHYVSGTQFSSSVAQSRLEALCEYIDKHLKEKGKNEHK